MANVPFHITDEKGNTFKGLTDSDGCCARVYTDGAQTLKVLTGVLALEKW
jgi:type VI secretion system secreted protein VgrG